MSWELVSLMPADGRHKLVDPDSASSYDPMMDGPHRNLDGADFEEVAFIAHLRHGTTHVVVPVPPRTPMQEWHSHLGLLEFDREHLENLRERWVVLPN